jgi:hypothetical protein
MELPSEIDAFVGISAQTVDFGLELVHKLRALLNKNREEPPKFAIRNVLCRITKTLFAVFARFDQVTKNGYDFVVIHMEFAAPHLVNGNCRTTSMSVYATACSATSAK